MTFVSRVPIGLWLLASLSAPVQALPVNNPPEDPPPDCEPQGICPPGSFAARTKACPNDLLNKCLSYVEPPQAHVDCTVYAGGAVCEVFPQSAGSEFSYVWEVRGDLSTPGPVYSDDPLLLVTCEGNFGSVRVTVYGPGGSDVALAPVDCNDL